MLYINVVVIIITATLAIISRKHYSKYKDGVGVKSRVLAVGLSMGHSVWLLFNNVLPLEGITDRLMERLRKNNIVSPKGLELLTEKYIATRIAVVIGILFTFNLFEFGNTLYNKFLRDEENIIIREEYRGDVIEEEIYYQLSGQEQTIVLNVSPVRLSEEAFYSKADQVAVEMEEKYFSYGEIISQDMELPLVDEEGVFDLSWESNNPEIISSNGRIKTQLDETPKKARLNLTISYYDYSAKYDFVVQVGAKKKSELEKKSEYLEQALNSLEQETVDNQELLLPDKIDDVEITLGKNKEKNGRFVLIGILVAVITTSISIGRLKDIGRERDKKLMAEYPYFVDSLWIYIESGMNLKRAIMQYVETSNKENGILVEHLRYTLNQIDNGVAEYVAYEELGSRLELPVYVSLMRHISQNLRMGTKDLRILMETEVSMALEAKKETAKKIGEEASTKLIFPMIVLLVVVMVLIMTPAFMGF